MKNLQTRFLKIHLFVTFFFLLVAGYAQSPRLATADSLFKAKRYTQSLEIYQALHQQGTYTPAMLLKMAYIQEGLGHVGLSLYYLRLYHLATDDAQALEKMQELATKYSLVGYEENDINRLQRWVDKNRLVAEAALLLFILALTLVTFLLKRKKKPTSFSLGFIALLILGVFYLNNFATTPSVITAESRVYLMEGPSAGAPVEGILGDGNQLKVIGKEDVWLKVKWMDKKVFVKENAVLRVAL